MNTWHNRDTDLLCEAILKLQTTEEVYAFLDDVCTIKEIKDISQRLKVATLLRAGVSYIQISKETGASTATISRVSKCCEYGAGGYRTVFERLDGGNDDA